MKSYASVASQLQRLSSLGMQINDESKATRCLERIGYYRLSAYWYPFRKVTQNGFQIVAEDDFIDGTSFDEIIAFYVFDKELRLLVSDALERIEVALRAQIADLLGARNALAHRLPAELSTDFVTKPSNRKSNLTRHVDWLNAQDRNFGRSKEEFAKHFRSKHPGAEPPIWIAKEVWDWGMLSHLFWGMKPKDQKGIARLYGKINAPEMESWLRTLNDIRNYCAHHSRLWNRGMASVPRLPSPGLYLPFDNIRSDPLAARRLYVGLLIMSLMVRSLHPNSRWTTRLIDLVARAPQHPVIDVRAAGFPANWSMVGFL